MGVVVGMQTMRGRIGCSRLKALNSLPRCGERMPWAWRPYGPGANGVQLPGELARDRSNSNVQRTARWAWHRWQERPLERRAGATADCSTRSPLGC
jgi:hypothetical protein